MESKAEIRKRLLSLRLSLKKEEVLKKSELALHRVLSLPEWKAAKRILLYSPIKNEVETLGLHQRAIEQGKEIFYPRVRKKGLEVVPVTSSDDLKSGFYGILEPMDGESAPWDVLDLVVLPALAADEWGRRIGYGQGYYDRALKEFRGNSLCLVFDFQILSKIPQDPWDVQCRRVVSDARTILNQM